MTRTDEIWQHDLRGPIRRKIESAKNAGRGVNVSPYWLTRILDRLEKHEPLKPYQRELRITAQESPK